VGDGRGKELCFSGVMNLVSRNCSTNKNVCLSKRCGLREEAGLGWVGLVPSGDSSRARSQAFPDQSQATVRPGMVELVWVFTKQNQSDYSVKIWKRKIKKLA
jgi:hypothetical protein